MEIRCEHYFDADMKALYDDGVDVSYGGETLAFSDAERTLIYSIDEITPHYAVLYDSLVNGVRIQPRLSATSSGSGAFQVSSTDDLFVNSLRFLSDERSVEHVGLYYGPSGCYRFVPLAQFLRLSSP